jgi:hypothetical protein
MIHLLAIKFRGFASTAAKSSIDGNGMSPKVNADAVLLNAGTRTGLAQKLLANESSVILIALPLAAVGCGLPAVLT